MSTPMHDQMESALADLNKQRDRIRTFEEQRSQTTGTAHSKNRMVTATVDNTGRLTGLKFEGAAYRKIAPAELASIVTHTVQQAQSDAATQAMTAAAKLMPDAFTLLGMTGPPSGAAGPLGDKGVTSGTPSAPTIDIDAMLAAAMKMIDAPIFQDQPPITGEQDKR